MINQLVDKIKKTNAPVVVGLDPMLSYIPEHILTKAYGEFGETLEGAAEAIFEYNINSETKRLTEQMRKEVDPIKKAELGSRIMDLRIRRDNND